jgi:hypothetical protein
MNRNELKHLVYQNYGIRVHPAATEQHMVALLNLEERVTPAHGINDIRDKVMLFIDSHKGRLAISCDGNCYDHTDATVLGCYKKYLESLEDAPAQ